jgi:hypothetical protein
MQGSSTQDFEEFLRHFLFQGADPNSAKVSVSGHSSASSFCIARLAE